MTDIPVIERLGDALDAATADRLPDRVRRRRRRVVLVVGFAAATALGATALAIAHALSSPDVLAANSVACYAAADLGSSMTVVANEGAPVAACGDAYRGMGQIVPAMVACSNGSSVAVFPGADGSTCSRLGLEPLPAGFAASQANVAKLARSVMAVEGGQDCIQPDELARRVRRLLVDQGWIGWTVHTPARGPCGSVTGLDGSGTRRIEGALDASRKTVLVSSAPARSTTALLYGPNGLAVSLENLSGERCYSVAGLTALVHARTHPTGRSASIALVPPLPTGATFGDDRQSRYEAGCAVVIDVRGAGDGFGIVAVIPRPRAR
jgi:hypothetical protein